VEVAVDIVQIEAMNLPDAWYQTLYAAVDKGRVFTIDRGSYAGQKRLEFDFAVIHVKQPGMLPLVPSMPESSPIPPPVTEEYLADYLPYLMTGAIKPGESYTYGQRLCHMLIDGKMAAERFDRQSIYIDAKEWVDPAVTGGTGRFDLFLNQMELMIRTYKKHGHRNNQMILQVAQPTDMLLRDSPCLRTIDTRIQDGKLHFFPYFRSWDLFGGFPANLAGIELMKQYCASEIGVENGEIIATSKGLHLYDHIWPVVEALRGKALHAKT
jgi:thymidylate synthase